MNFRFYLREYFRYSKSEKAAIRVLSIILLVSCIYPCFMHNAKGDCCVNSFCDTVNIVRNKYDTIPAFKMPEKKYIDILEINSADTNKLKKLRGIGSYYATKIVRYRSRLGGFYSVDQLQDIKMRAGIFEKVKPHIIVDKSLVKKFDIDTISFKNLLRHPYFDYEHVKAIFKIKYDYRGITPEYLLYAKLIDTAMYFKIKPYCVEKK